MFLYVYLLLRLTVRLKLIVVQLMCSKDNKKYGKYLVINSVREMSFKTVYITVTFLPYSFFSQVTKLWVLRVVWLARIMWSSKPLYSVLTHNKNIVTSCLIIKRYTVVSYNHLFNTRSASSLPCSIQTVEKNCGLFTVRPDFPLPPKDEAAS